MVIAVLAVSGVVLGAWYMLWLVQRVFFGPLKEAHLRKPTASEIRDLSLRMKSLRWRHLVVFIVWIGLFPRLFLATDHAGRRCKLSLAPSSRWKNCTPVVRPTKQPSEPRQPIKLTAE